MSLLKHYNSNVGYTRRNISGGERISTLAPISLTYLQSCYSGAVIFLALPPSLAASSPNYTLMNMSERGALYSALNSMMRCLTQIRASRVQSFLPHCKCMPPGLLSSVHLRPETKFCLYQSSQAVFQPYEESKRARHIHTSTRSYILYNERVVPRAASLGAPTNNN